MNSVRTKAYLAVVIAAGAVCLGHGLWTWTSPEPGKYLSYLLLALAASRTKIRLQSTATMSLSFLFVLISVAAFSRGQCLLMGCLGVLVQSFAHAKPTPVQISFNVAGAAIAVDVAYAVQHAPGFYGGLLTAAAYFTANTLPIAIVIALTEHGNAWNTWRRAYFWSFPNYLVGAATAWLVGKSNHLFGWQAGLLSLPILYVIYSSHRAHRDRLDEARQRMEEQNAHAVEMAALHRRTIETLALAVEAKDQTTHDHIARVETYAIEVGKELGIQGTELEALGAAALLHDIGKLAIPEYIVSKPGKLTPEEFEKMKTHTVVGAEIAERIHFPYPVAPMVRGHHERWNGTGYPDGLAGEQIPIGARILAAVDCLDALASDRQYRRAMPLSEAIEVVKSEAGKSFDPAVVEILARRCVEIDALVKSQTRIAKLPTAVRVERGSAPAAGFEKTAGSEASRDLAALHRAVGPALRNPQALSELLTQIANCPSRERVLHTLRTSLRSVVSYDVMAVYRRNGDRLLPDCADGDDSGLFGSVEGTVGAGLSGWVAENGRAIVNGNPEVEPLFIKDPSRFSNLRSALAVPLIGNNGIGGVLSLYRQKQDAFTSADLSALTALSSKVADALNSTANQPVLLVPSEPLTP